MAVIQKSQTDMKTQLLPCELAKAERCMVDAPLPRDLNNVPSSFRSAFFLNCGMKVFEYNDTLQSKLKSHSFKEEVSLMAF